MTRSSVCPIASAALWLNMRSAVSFHSRIIPSRSAEMTACGPGASAACAMVCSLADNTAACPMLQPPRYGAAHPSYIMRPRSTPRCFLIGRTPTASTATCGYVWSLAPCTSYGRFQCPAHVSGAFLECIETDHSRIGDPGHQGQGGSVCRRDAGTRRRDALDRRLVLEIA